jgi:hypothetical protein
MSEWTSITAGYADSAGNADTVDGYHATGGNKPFGTIPVITSSGFMDVGDSFEMHYDNTTGSDYSTRLYCTGNYGNSVALPSASGTLALTSDLSSYLPKGSSVSDYNIWNDSDYGFSEWTPAQTGTPEDYGTSLNFRDPSTTWYYRLMFGTWGRIYFRSGINTTSLSQVGTIAYLSDIPSTISYSQITDGTSSSTSSDWSHTLRNFYGGSERSSFYMCHGGGYGAHIRSFTSSSDVYIL